MHDIDQARQEIARIERKFDMLLNLALRLQYDLDRALKGLPNDLRVARPTMHLPKRLDA